MKKIALKEVGHRIHAFWQPREIAIVNNTALRLAKILGPYNWHVHKNEDEFFLVVEGEVSVDTEDGTIDLKEGEGFLVPRGTRHRSKSDSPATILLIEPTSTLTKGERSANAKSR